MTAKKTPKADANAKFSKQQIMTSERYAHRRDLVGSLLKDEEEYDLSEVDALIKEFMERKVN